MSSLDKKLNDLIILIKSMSMSSKATGTTSTSVSKLTVVNIPTHIQRPIEIKDFKSKSLNDLEKLLDNKLSNLSVKPIGIIDIFPIENDISEIKRIENVREEQDRSIKHGKYATKPAMMTYYYPRPTPQDVLIEEIDWIQTNIAYSDDQIYEWNLDGLTDMQVSILVHRMLMYDTICQSTIIILIILLTR